MSIVSSSLHALLSRLAAARIDGLSRSPTVVAQVDAGIELGIDDGGIVAHGIIGVVAVEDGAGAGDSQPLQPLTCHLCKAMKITPCVRRPLAGGTQG